MNNLIIVSAILLGIQRIGANSLTSSDERLSKINFDNPDQLTKDCENALNGLKLMKFCQDQAYHDYDPAIYSNSTETLWETCCSLFDELQCYIDQGKTHCPKATYTSLKQYVYDIQWEAETTMCTDAGYSSDWASYCKNLTQEASHHHHKLDIKLPRANGTEWKCLKKLWEDGDRVEGCRRYTKQHFIDVNGTDIDATITCCAEYEMLDCVEYEAYKHCSKDEADEVWNWASLARYHYGFHLCRSVPYYSNGEHSGLVEKTHEICKTYGFDLHSSSNSLNIFLHTGLVLLTLTVGCLGTDFIRFLL